jgi:hypothetical protein
MKFIAGASLSLAALLAAAPSAGAVTVKPIGKYAVTVVESCEAKIGFANGTYLTNATDLNASTDPPKLDKVAEGALKSVNAVGGGHLGSGVGYITFNANHTYVLTLTNIGGMALRVVLPQQGPNFAKKTVTYSGPFTFSSSGMNLKNGAVNMSFWASYGELDATGRPNSVHLVRQFIGTETSNCVQAVTATR